MALVVQAPILIDGTNFSRQSGFSAPRFLFRRGSNVYALLRSQLDQSNIMYKSTDEGQTWIILDAANSPPSTAQVIATYDDIDNDVIGIALVQGGIAAAYVDFSTTTDTWGTVSNSFAFMGTGWSIRAFYRNLAGTPIILMNQGTSANLWAITYTAGSWSAPGAPIFTAPATCGYGNGIRDSAGTYHAQLSTGTGLYYFSVNDSLVSSAAVLLATGFGLGGFDTGRVIIDGSTVRGTAVVEPTAGNYEVLAWAGTPLATPVFTTYIVSTTTAGQLFTYPGTVLDKDGNWVVFWVLTSSTLDQEMMSTFDGVSTFGAPIVFYDAIANPPPNVDAGSNFIHTDDETQFSDGVWLMLTAMETLDLGASCTGFALVTPPISPPAPTLACPVGNTAQVGVPYTGLLQASGGTPPYTFAIIA